MKFPPSSLLPDFRVFNRSISVGTSPAIFLPADPNRFSFMPWPRSVGQWVVGPSPQVASGFGFRVDFTQSPQIWTFSDLGPIVGLDWWAVSLAGPFTGLVTEVIYSPRQD